VNGQTGVNNPQRQGLNSAVLGDGDPINVLRWNPRPGALQPALDVHLSAWTDEAIAAGINTRQSDYGTVQGLSITDTLPAPAALASPLQGSL